MEGESKTVTNCHMSTIMGGIGDEKLGGQTVFSKMMPSNDDDWRAHHPDMV